MPESTELVRLMQTNTTRKYGALSYQIPLHDHGERIVGRLRSPTVWIGLALCGVSWVVAS